MRSSDMDLKSPDGVKSTTHVKGFTRSSTVELM